MPEAARKGFREAYNYKDTEKALRFYREMEETNAINQITVVAMMKLLKLSKRYDEAIEVFKTSENTLEYPTIEMFTQLISVYLQANRIDEAEQLIDVLERDVNLKKTSHYYTTILRFFSGVGRLQDTMEAYSKVTSSQNLPLDCLLRCAQKFQFLDESKEILDSVVDQISISNVELDDRLLSQFTENISLTDDVFDVLVKNNLKVSSSVAYKLIKTSVYQKDFAYTLKLYNTSYYMGHKPTQRMIGDLLASATRAFKQHYKVAMVYVHDIMVKEYKKHGTMPTQFFIKTYSFTLKAHTWSKGLKFENIDYWKQKNSFSKKEIDTWVEDSSTWTKLFKEKNQHRLPYLDLNANFLGISKTHTEVKSRPEKEKKQKLDQNEIL